MNIIDKGQIIVMSTIDMSITACVNQIDTIGVSESGNTLLVNLLSGKQIQMSSNEPRAIFETRAKNALAKFVAGSDLYIRPLLQNGKIVLDFQFIPQD